MHYDGRPQNDADRLRPESSSRKHKRYNEVVDDHRGDQSSRAGALRVSAGREPAGNAECKQSSPANARDSARSRFL